MMQASGISLDVIDRCQNHVLAGSHEYSIDTGDTVRGALQTIGVTAGHIKKGSVKLTAQVPH